jgi:hypothetical protein
MWQRNVLLTSNIFKIVVIKHCLYYVCVLLSCACVVAKAQEKENTLLNGLNLNIESSTVVSNGDFAPFWLSSNRYGLTSVEANSNYERISLFRHYSNDSLRTWKIGYGLDVAIGVNSNYDYIVQQAYADVVYKKIKLTVGAKQHPIDLRNNRLTSGGLGIGINAHPVPQVRIEADYFSMPGTNQWWKIRFRGSYGMTTDGRWQEDFHAAKSRYTTNTLYHEKALYWKFGKENKFPMTFEIGLQMATQFGGTTYNVTGRGFDGLHTMEHSQGLQAFWDATFASGSDATDGVDKNTAGNHFGSYNMALEYKAEKWGARAYFERTFDDQSMLTVQYGIYDHLLGLEVNLPKNRLVSSVVLEHISTTDQSGAVYHDKTVNLPDKMNGRDDYYNHLLYTGNQHWGMTMGNPLLTSPIYNSNKHIYFYNNRVKAWHLGFSGEPTSEIAYRALLTFTRNWGTYKFPFDDILRQNYMMAEVTYSPKRLKGVSATLGCAYDDGDVLGNSFGGQFTLRKTFNFFK